MSNLAVFYKLASLKNLIQYVLPKSIYNQWNDIVEQNEAAKEMIANFIKEDIEKRMATGKASSFEVKLHSWLTKACK